MDVDFSKIINIIKTDGKLLYTNGSAQSTGSRPGGMRMINNLEEY